MKIGETILKLREEKKMSQEEFAEYFHVTRQTISNWEKEKSFPDLQTLVKISDAAGVSVDSMLRDNFIMILWMFGYLNMMERLIWAMLQRMKWHRLLE